MVVSKSSSSLPYFPNTLWSELAGLVGVGRVCCASWVLNWCISQFGNYTATCIPTCHAPDTINHLQFLAFFSLPFFKKKQQLMVTYNHYKLVSSFFFFSLPVQFISLDLADFKKLTSLEAYHFIAAFALSTFPLSS